MPVHALYIVGAGGLGRETAILVERIRAAALSAPAWALEGFVDDNPDLHYGKVLDYPLCGDVDWLASRQDATYVVAVGASTVRRQIVQRLEGVLDLAAPLIDPALFVHASVSVGAGSLMYRGAVVMAAAALGRSVVVDANATVGHDTSIGDFVTILPGVNIAGGVTIESGVQLGTGSTVLPGVSIGHGTIVGAGAVVTNDLPAGCTAVGVPARPIDHSNQVEP